MIGWTSIAAAGPAAREDHTWTLDPEGRVAYLFGGRTADNVALDDLHRATRVVACALGDLLASH